MRQKKYKHAKKPKWRIYWRPKAMHWIPYSSDAFATYREAFLDWLAWQEKRNGYNIALYRVQPLVCGEPGWCEHQPEARTHIMGDRL